MYSDYQSPSVDQIPISAQISAKFSTTAAKLNTKIVKNYLRHNVGEQRGQILSNSGPMLTRGILALHHKDFSDFEDFITDTLSGNDFTSPHPAAIRESVPMNKYINNFTF